MSRSRDHAHADGNKIHIRDCINWEWSYPCGRCELLDRQRTVTTVILQESMNLAF